MPHNFDFLDQTFLALVLTICCLFGEGLDSIGCFVLEFFSQINRSEVSLTDFFDRFELLVETALVELSFEYLTPVLDNILGFQIITQFGIVFLERDLSRVGREAVLDVEVELKRPPCLAIGLASDFDQSFLVHFDLHFTVIFFRGQ